MQIIIKISKIIHRKKSSSMLINTLLKLKITPQNNKFCNPLKNIK
jgi:hypothetical protein